MRHFVHGEGSRLAETLAAVVALEGLFFGVNVAVISEMVLATEGLAADVTAVGAFVGVGSLVDQQIVAFRELSVAVFADELLLWARSSSAGDFQGSDAVACDRWQSLIVGVAAVMHVLLINRSTSDPMAHQSSMVLGRCRSRRLVHLSISHRIRCR